jgi:glycine/D-amino acid oxidase-like deaminating enzyme
MKISNTPTWQADLPAALKLKKFPKLNQNLDTDVVIIGGGMVGILSAYLLGKTGKSVVILESGKILQGATSMTTAFLTQNYDTDIPDSISIYGKKKTQLIWESHGKAIDLIEQIIKTEKIDCEFMRCSNFAYINSQDDSEVLEKEYKAMKQLGFKVQLRKNDDLKFKNFGYIETKNQAKFHSLKFLYALAGKLSEMDVQIYEQSAAEEINGDGPVEVKVGKYAVRAKNSITATYSPLNNPIQTFAKKGMYVSYVYELRVEKGLFKEGIYEDFENPYHYFRIDRGAIYDRMIIGGEDNRKEIEFRKEKNFKALHAYLTHLIPSKKFKVVRKWRGPILEPSDGLPLIGKYRAGQYVATAFSGNGMTYSGVAAMMFRDLITKKKNPWTSLYNPKRLPTVKQLAIKAKDYGEELINAAGKNTFKY